MQLKKRIAEIVSQC